MIDAQLLVVDNTSTPTGSATRCSAKSSTPTCSPRNEHACTAASPRRCSNSPADALRRADRAGELAFHLDRAGDSEGAFVALLAAADAAETIAPGAAFGHLERAFELWDAVGERAAHGRAAVTGCGRPPTSPRPRSATSERSRSLEPRSQAGPPPLGAAWGHERLGRYLWSTGRLEESRVEFAAGSRAADGRRGRRCRAPCSPVSGKRS